MSATTERAVLACILLDPDCIIDARDHNVTPTHFRDPDHAAIYRAMLACADKRMPPDLHNVSVVLDRTPKDDDDTPWSVHLSHLLGEPVVPSRFWSFRETLISQYRNRKAQDTFRRGIEQLQADDADPAAILAAALIELDSDRTTGPQPFSVYADLMDERLNQQERGEYVEEVTPTGFPSLDKALGGGFRPGELIVVAGRPGMGKALALGTPLPTPTGWTTMGDVQVGDSLLDEHGNPCTVVAATDVMHDRPVYRLTFSDGAQIVADANHQWATSTRQRRKRGDVSTAIVTTEEIAASVRVDSDQRANHAVPIAEPLQLPDADLPIPPYTLGAWLADGASNGAVIYTPDVQVVEIIERIEKVPVAAGTPKAGANCMTYRIGGYGRKGGSPEQRAATLQATLRREGLLNNKHIPAAYLRGSVKQRSMLLAGLMDSDGYVDPKTGTCEITTVHDGLKDTIPELVRSLGFLPSVTTKWAMLDEKRCGPYTRITFTPDRRVFMLPRKQQAQVFRGNGKTRLRYITDVERIPSEPVRCVQVDSPSHLYLAGRDMIPTHNSLISLAFARHAARRSGALLFSLEMSGLSIYERAIADEAGIGMDVLRQRRLDADTVQQLRRVNTLMRQANVYVDDTAGLTTAQAGSRVARHLVEHPSGLVLIDYLQIMGDERARNTSGADHIAKISGFAKKLAMQHHVPVVLLSQLNRNVEHRDPPIPVLSDLRDSGAIEQDADTVLMLYRHDYYARKGMTDPDETKAGTCDVFIRKHRNGPEGVVSLGFDGATMSFRDPALAPPAWMQEGAAD